MKGRNLPTSSWNEKCFWQKTLISSKHTFGTPPPKIVTFVRYCGKYDRARQAADDSVIRRLCVAAWIPKATDAHSEYVIRIASMQQLLHERA